MWCWEKAPFAGVKIKSLWRPTVKWTGMRGLTTLSTLSFSNSWTFWRSEKKSPQQHWSVSPVYLLGFYFLWCFFLWNIWRPYMGDVWQCGLEGTHQATWKVYPEECCGVQRYPSCLKHQQFSPHECSRLSLNVMNTFFFPPQPKQST